MKVQSQKKTKVVKTSKPVGEIKGKKRDRSTSEARLLEAGEVTFAKHGFAGTTTKLIAQKAKLNEALIARYFGSKQGLFIAIIQNHIKEMHAELNYEPKDSLHDEIAAFYKKKLEAHCRHDEGFFRIVMSQVLVDAKFAKRMRTDAPMGADEGLLKRMQGLSERGLMRSDIDLRAFAEAIQLHAGGVFMFDQVLKGKDEAEILVSLMNAADMFAAYGRKQK